MKKYSRAYILEECQNRIHPIERFYREPLVNRIGKTNDTDEYYTEVIAEFLLRDENLKLLDSIEMISREDYSVEWHDGIYDSDSNRLEEHLAMDMYNMTKRENCSFYGVGKMIAYQIPLNKKREDAAGKIDLLSQNNDVAYILELKVPESRETMLRCLLESYTYLKRINRSKLIESLHIETVKYVKAAPFVFFKGHQWDEMQQDRPFMKKLMEKLHMMDVFYYEKHEEKYIVKV